MKKIYCSLVILFFAFATNAQWVQVPNGMGVDQFVNCLAVKGSLVFAGTRSDGIFLTTNNGNNWNTVNNGLSVLNINMMSCDNIKIVAATVNGGLYISTNNGNVWNLSSNGMTDANIVSVLVKGSAIFAGTYDHGVFRSTNNGTTWVNCFSTARPFSLFAKDSYLFVGTIYNGVYRSSNNGVSWDTANTGLENVSVFDFISSENAIYAGTRKYSGSDTCGVFRSTDYGNSWFPANGGILTFDTVYALTNVGPNIFAGTKRGVFLSTNSGINWIAINQGFTILHHTTDLQIANSYIFDATINREGSLFGQSVWRRPLAEVIGIRTISTETPSAFSLTQNYPNPFNPTTKIRFAISGSSAAQTFLSVYDMLGREISTLVNEELKPGIYEAEWNASSYPSGVYFYRLSVFQAGFAARSYVETKKMVLIR